MDKVSDSNEILLSIVIPVYNVEDYIEECLKSVINQLTPSIEVLIINDGSLDKSFEICKKLCIGLGGVKFHEKVNGGLSDTRNFGIDKALGKYVLFLDSDDYLMSNSLKDIVESISRSKADFFVSGYNMLKFGTFEQKKIENKKKGEATIEDVPNLLSNAWRYIVNKDFIINNKLYFRVGMLSEDIEWISNVIYKSKSFELINENFYVYRVDRVGSIMSDNSIKRQMDALEGIVNSYELLNDLEDTIKKRLLSNGLRRQLVYNLASCDKLKPNQLEYFFKKSKLMFNDRVFMGYIYIFFKIMGTNKSINILSKIKKIKNVLF